MPSSNEKIKLPVCSTMSLYHSIIRNSDGKQLPLEHISHVVVFFADGSQVIIDKDILVCELNGVRNPTFKNSHVNVPDIKAMKAFIDVAKFAYKIDRETEEFLEPYYK